MSAPDDTAQIELLELRSRVLRLDQDLKLRDDFLSIAAHELKTPIAAAKLKFQTALRILESARAVSLPPEKIAQLFRDGDHQMSRLTRLIDNLLDLSRLQTGRLHIQPEPMDLCELIREIVERYAQQLAFAKCPVTLELPERLEGHWDRDRLDQVLTNLVTNALRYAPGSPVCFRAVLEETEVVFSLTDEGPGIPPEFQSRIFDRYERGSSSGQGRGMGLGLYVTREIIQEHGGSIRVESTLRHGTRFEVRLPIDSRVA